LPAVAILFSMNTTENSHRTYEQLQRENEKLRQTNQTLQKKCYALEQQLQALAEECQEKSARLKDEQTSRRRLEQKTRILRHAVETMHLGVTITDMNRRIFYTNPADARMHGYSVEELRGKDVSIFAPHEQRRKISLEEISGTPGWIRESINIRKDGIRFPVYLMSSLVKDEKGQPIAMITTCEDISKRKQAEEALAAERNLLRALIDNIPDSIYVKDRKGRYVLSNKAQTLSVGMKTPQQVIGHTVFDLFPEELALQYRTSDQAVFRSGEPLVELEESGSTQDGKTLALLTTKIPLRNTRNQIIGLVGISRDITKRKCMENALRHSEQEKSLILNSMSEMLIYYDKELRILWTNRAAVQALGQSSEELVGKPCHTLWWHRREPYPQSPGKQALKTLTPQEGEFASPKGETWFIRAYPVIDKENLVVGLVEFARNITAQKQAQARIDHLNAVLNAIRNVNQLIVRENDPQTLIQTACDQLIKARGYASSWIILLDEAEHVTLMAQSGVDDQLQHLRQQVKDSGLPYCLQKAVRNKHDLVIEYTQDDLAQCCSGKICCNHEKIAIKLQHEGRLHGLLFVALPQGVIADEEEEMLLEEIAHDMAFALHNIEIEEKHLLAEQAVHENEEWLAATLNNLSEAVMTTDDHGKVTYFNPIAEELTGWTKEEMLGKDVTFQVLSEEPATPLQGGESDSQPHIAIVLGDYAELIAKDGSRIPVEYSGKPIRNEQRQFTGFVMVFRDITERKEMELALERERASLAEKVEERTAELSAMNERLHAEIVEREQLQIEAQQAREAAEAANWAKSQFLANMSHELRTPLNAILGYAQIIKNTSNLHERQINGLDIIKNSGTHLLNLINEILDLSKIEAGRMELHLTDASLPYFLKHVAEMIRVRANQKGITFLFDLDPRLPIGVRVDEKKLRQILINLLGNAVKFTEQGSVTFRVKRLTGKPSTCHNSQRVMIHFEVVDTGIGIAQGHLKKIFRPFQQVGERHHSIEGTGLGLTISHKLIRLMNSELLVESVLGKGTIFQFDLLVEEVPDFLPVPTTVKRIIQGYKGARRTVLVVDDRPENRLLLKDMLSPLGFNVLEAGDGQQCIEQMQEHQPDITLLDLRMPIMDGLTAAKQIRESGKFTESVIIAVSASVYEEDRHKSLQAGCNDFLTKPLPHDELLAVFQKYLNLEWTYKDDEPGPQTAETTTSPSPPVHGEICLPRADKEILLKFAESGRVKPLMKHLDTLGHKYQAVADELRQLAKTFQLHTLKEKIRSMEDIP